MVSPLSRFKAGRNSQVKIAVKLALVANESPSKLLTLTPPFSLFAGRSFYTAPTFGRHGINQRPLTYGLEAEFGFKIASASPTT